MSLVTCHTDGCANAGEAIELTLTFDDPDTGETQYVDAVSCGVCGQQITDIEPPLPSDEPQQEGSTS